MTHTFGPTMSATTWTVTETGEQLWHAKRPGPNGYELVEFEAPADTAADTIFDLAIVTFARCDEARARRTRTTRL